MDGEAAARLSQAVKRIRDASSDSSARQALHRHLISITQYLAARKIIPHPNGTISRGCKFSACSSPQMRGGSIPCFHGLSNGTEKRKMHFLSIILCRTHSHQFFPPSLALQRAFVRGKRFSPDPGKKQLC